MATFPQLDGGIVTGLPFTSEARYRTSVSDSPGGQRYSYAWRDSPLMAWELSWSALTDAQAADLEAFFEARKGRFESFAFVDPSGNLVSHSEDYGDASWSKTSVSVGSAQADPFGGSLARRLTSSGSGGQISATVGGGYVTGYVLCVSAWVKALSPGQTLRLALGAASATYSAPQSWERLSFAAVAAGGSVVAALGGSGTWNGTSIDIFGAQVSAMPGPGAYAKTPGHGAVFANCRFDQDELIPTKEGYDRWSARVRIVEFAA